MISELRLFKTFSLPNLPILKRKFLLSINFSPGSNSNDQPIIALPSRMLWVKGVGEFVSAAQVIKKTHKCRFVLIGENDDNNPNSINTNQLLKWQNEGLIEWWGHQKNMPAIMKKIDIVCLPSYREGLPKALLEAASSGVPIAVSYTHLTLPTTPYV